MTVGLAKFGNKNSLTHVPKTIESILQLNNPTANNTFPIKAPITLTLPFAPQS